MSIRDYLLSEENLIANGFKQDKEISTCWYYRGMFFDLTTQQGRQEAEDMLDEIQRQEQINDMYDYDTVEVNTRVEKKIKINKNKEWNVPMCTEESIIRNKKIDYKTLALLSVNSNYKSEEVCRQFGIEYNPNENYRYLYKNSIRENKEELEKLSKWKLDTIQRNIKKLETNGNGFIEVCADNKGKVYYRIYPLTKEGEANNYKYVTIDSRILKYLVRVFDSTAIKVYCSLVWILAEGEKQITYEFLAKTVGLSTKGNTANGNLKTIADILYTLEEVKLIEREIFYDTKDLINGSIPIKCYKYKLTTNKFIKNYSNYHKS